MEFVSIPWGNGCDDNHESYRKWTVNLALWFTHILAGNNYRIDWGYPHLRDEKIVDPPQQPAQRRKRKRDTESAAPQQPVQGRKRTRNALNAASQSLDAAQTKRHKARHQTSPSQEEKDVPKYSFCGEPIPQPQVSLLPRPPSQNSGC